MSAATMNETVVLPFEIEADHPRNSTLRIMCIDGGLMLRSAFNGMKGARDAKGRLQTPLDQASTYAGHPEMPGMRLSVNPAKLEYEIIDPMHNNPLCDDVLAWAQQHMPLPGNATFNGEKPRGGKLDVHQMKSLCRELLNIINSGEAKVTRGPKPSEDQIAMMPGRFILNPGLQTATTQPRYEDDLENWVQTLSHNGG